MCEISIVIPVYNTEAKLLETCVRSVREQSLTSLEIVLVDDGSSTAETVACCEEMAKQDERVRVITQENQGQSGARQTGLLCAEGRFIMFVDSDDRINQDMCEYLLYLIEKTGADFAECMAYSGETPKWQDNWIESITEGREELLLQAVRTCDFPVGWSLWGKLFRTDLMQKSYVSDSDIYYGEDVLCLVRYLMHADKGVFSDKKLYYYNISNADSMTKNVSEKKLTMCAFGWQMVQLYEEFPVREGKLRARAIYCDLLFGNYLACSYHKFGDYKSICRRIRTEYKKYTADIWNNPYITSRKKQIILRYCPVLFLMHHSVENKLKKPYIR